MKTRDGMCLLILALAGSGCSEQQKTWTKAVIVYNLMNQAQISMDDYDRRDEHESVVASRPVPTTGKQWQEQRKQYGTVLHVPATN